MDKEQCGKPVTMRFTLMELPEKYKREIAPEFWRLDEKTLKAIEAIEANSRRAAHNAQFFLLD